jgi:hypothetical protein
LLNSREPSRKNYVLRSKSNTHILARVYFFGIVRGDSHRLPQNVGWLPLL